jgi:YfiR/HmsC-like
MSASPSIAKRIQRRLVAMALASLMAAGTQAQPLAAEETVEAAYLHKFPGFVDWPADTFRNASSPIVIGLVAAPRVLDELTRVARGRLVLGRPVEARAVDASALPRDLQVLFIGKDASADAAPLIDEARRAHVLVVTDIPGGLKAGAVIDFVQIDGRLRFEASLSAARRADIRLSSNLLSVAARVVEETP